MQDTEPRKRGITSPAITEAQTSGQHSQPLSPRGEHSLELPCTCHSDSSPGALRTQTATLTAALSLRATSQKPLRQPAAAEWGDRLTGHSPEHDTDTHTRERQPRTPARTDQVDQGSKTLEPHTELGHLRHKD